MTVFGVSDRGKFHITSVDAAGGQGIQVSVPGGGSPLGEASLVTSFGAEQRENYSVSQCLNGGVYLYTFGHDPQGSQFTLGISSFLNTCSGKRAADLAQALQVYKTGRVSQSRALASMSVGDAVLRGYLIGQSVAVVDTAIGIVASTYTFVALNPQEGG